MAKNFIIFVPEVGKDFAQWAKADSSGALNSEPGSGSLTEASTAASGHRSVVVLPGAGVLLAEALVPGGSAARAQQAVPYVLEEQVADDIDDLHFALGSRSNSGAYPVAVIDREAMDTLKEQFASSGLRPAEVVPETLALPKYDPQAEGEVWTALYDDKHAIVRTNGYKGFVTDTETAEIMLTGALREAPEDHSIGGLVVFHTSRNLGKPSIPGMEVETRQCQNRLGLYAAGLANSPTINLLQGDYSLKQQFDKAWKPWRWTFALLAGLAALLFSNNFIEYFKLGQQEAQLDNEIVRVFKDAVPGVTIRDPKAQMLSRLRTLGSGGIAEGFIIELDRIASAIGSLEETSLDTIVFNKGRFDLGLTTDGYPSLDKLQQHLEKNGSMKMSVLSSNRKNGAVVARVRLEPK